MAKMKRNKLTYKQLMWHAYTFSTVWLGMDDKAPRLVYTKDEVGGAYIFSKDVIEVPELKKNARKLNKKDPNRKTLKKYPEFLMFHEIIHAFQHKRGMIKTVELRSQADAFAVSHFSPSLDRGHLTLTNWKGQWWLESEFFKKGEYDEPMVWMFHQMKEGEDPVADFYSIMKRRPFCSTNGFNGQHNYWDLPWEKHANEGALKLLKKYQRRFWK